MKYYFKISRFELNRMFAKKDFEKISKYVKHFSDELPYPLSKFKKEHIDALIDYASKNDYHLLWTILIEAPQADQRRIINCILDKSVFYSSKMYHDRIFEFFDLFLDEAIKRNLSKAVLLLAELAPRTEKSVEYMARITSYCEHNQKDKNLTLELSKIPVYNVEGVKKIIDSLLLKDIIIYISLCQNQDNVKTAIEDYFNKASIEEVDELLIEFSNNKAIFKLIYDYIKGLEDKEKSAAYLLEVFKQKPDYERNTIILTILVYGSIDTLNELMNMLPEKSQIGCCQAVLKYGNYDLIYNLAVTTDCTETYKLIDVTLELNDFYADLRLLANLKNRFLSYTWDYIFKNRSIDYIRSILNGLYLANSAGYICAIKFIVEYDYISLFNSEEKINIMEAYKQKEDMILTLKK